MQIQKAEKKLQQIFKYHLKKLCSKEEKQAKKKTHKNHKKS